MATTNNTENASIAEMLDSLNEIKEGITNEHTQEQLVKVMTDLNSTVQNIMSQQSTQPSMLQKLKSRKFWVAAVAVVGGLCGMLNAGQNTTAILIYVALAAVSVLGYFFTEGTIDSTRTKEMIQAATAIAEILGTLAPTLQAQPTALLESVELDPPAYTVPVEPTSTTSTTTDPDILEEDDQTFLV
ncbi:MAG: hypothetical protein K2F99_08920 [Muribaculaceae bacterium]|nr:hypothetical protein [Muribaculaceae bacterium]